VSNAPQWTAHVVASAMFGDLNQESHGFIKGPLLARVALVGPDTSGSAPGGMATISRTLITGFAGNPKIEIIPIPNFDEGSMFRRLTMGLRAVLHIVRLRHAIDLVHIQVATGWSIERDLLLASIARITGIPVVAQFHGAGQIDDYTEGHAIHRLCYRALLRSSHNLALGPNALSWMRSVDANVWAVIVPNGVDVSNEPSAFPKGEPNVVFVGRLGERKGMFDLLSAMERLHRDGTRLHLSLLGDGDLEAVRAHVEGSESLRDYVLIQGWQGEDGVKEAIRSSWALVLPSYAEGLPMAILEAMASGRAVVATRVGETDSVVADGTNGLLVDAGDVTGLTEALRRVASDAAFAESLGREGHVLAQSRFSKGALLEELERIYCSLVDANNEMDPR